MLKMERIYFIKTTHMKMDKKYINNLKIKLKIWDKSLNLQAVIILIWICQYCWKKLILVRLLLFFLMKLDYKINKCSKINLNDLIFIIFYFYILILFYLI